MMPRQTRLNPKRSHHRYSEVGMVSTAASPHLGNRLRSESTHNRAYLFAEYPIARRTISAASYKGKPASWVESELQPAMLGAHPRNTFGERHPDEPKRRDLAVALRKFTGTWVAIRGQEILASADGPLDLVNVLRDRGYRADSVFRVPRNAKEDILGEW